MAADPQSQEASSNDLFGRWLAHHEQQSTEPDEAGFDDISADSSPPPRNSRRMPSAATASSAVDRDPMIGTRIAAPSTFGVRRPAANTADRPGPVNELDREPPAGWEPIVMRSVRKKVEQAEAKQLPKPLDGRSRLQRLKARLVDPPAPEVDLDVEEEVPQVPLTPPVARAVPVAVPTPRAPLPTRSPSTPAAPAAPASPAARSVEETIAAAVPTVTRPAARHAEPQVEAPVQVPVETLVETPVETPVESAVQTLVETRVEQPVEVAASVARHVEPEQVAAPTPVRAFIDAAPAPSLLEPNLEPEPEAEPVAVVVEPEPYVEAYVEPVAEPVAESVVVEAEPESMRIAEPGLVVAPPPVLDAPVEVEPAPEPATEQADPPEDRPRLRSLLTLPKRQPRTPKPRPPRTGDAARDLVAAMARARASSPAAPVAEPAFQPAAVAVAAPPEPAVEPSVELEPLTASEHDEAAAEMPGTYKFVPKRTARRILTISLLIGFVVSAYFIRAAIEVRDNSSIGLAAIVVLATAMVWAIRAGASVTRLEVHQGQLEVIQQGGRFIFDLASQYTRFEVHGRPGHRGWKVLFPRRGMAPFTVDATMVDPDDFMRVLRFFRPQLVHH